VIFTGGAVFTCCADMFDEDELNIFLPENYILEYDEVVDDLEKLHDIYAFQPGYYKRWFKPYNFTLIM
jgi:hypothetical protein